MPVLPPRSMSVCITAERSDTDEGSEADAADAFFLELALERRTTLLL